MNTHLTMSISCSSVTWKYAQSFFVAVTVVLLFKVQCKQLHVWSGTDDIATVNTVKHDLAAHVLYVIIKMRMPGHLCGQELFCLNLYLSLLIMCENTEGSCKAARMHILSWVFIVRICNQASTCIYIFTCFGWVKFILSPFLLQICLNILPFNWPCILCCEKVSNHWVSMFQFLHKLNN